MALLGPTEKRRLRHEALLDGQKQRLSIALARVLQSESDDSRRAHDGTGPQARRPWSLIERVRDTGASRSGLDLAAGSPRDANSRTGFDHLGEKCTRCRMRLG